MFQKIHLQHEYSLEDEVKEEFSSKKKNMNIIIPKK